LVLLKGLPLAYDRDLQEDKEIVFGAVARTLGAIRATLGVLGAIRFDKQRMAEAAAASATWATDVAEEMVRRGTPFRQAHERAGELVKRYESGEDVGAEAFGFPTSTVLDSLERRDSYGGPAPARVRDQVAALRARLASLGA
jgi:argininosuccinate lyase